METLKTLSAKWPNQVRLLEWHRPLLILSKHGLSSAQLDQLRHDFVVECGHQLVSVITSIKMMHIYFRIESQTYDYRPHRGPFSRVSVSPFRLGSSDRLEILMRLTDEEIENFFEYVDHIQKNPTKVLGKSYPLSLREPDFTVRSHRTNAALADNRLIEAKDRHNCMTWFSTAPIGESKMRILEILKMSDADISDEAHSYIVAFCRFLAFKESAGRVEGAVLWTSADLETAVRNVQTLPDYPMSLVMPEKPASVVAEHASVHQ